MGSLATHLHYIYQRFLLFLGYVMPGVILVVKMEALAHRFPLYTSGNHLIYVVKNKIKCISPYPKSTNMYNTKAKDIDRHLRVLTAQSRGQDFRTRTHVPSLASYKCL